MKIKKVLNNNFVIAGDNNEKIIMGIGLGYRKRKGDYIDEKDINKIFHLSDSKLNMMLIELISTVPIEIINIVNKIVEKTNKEFNRNISDGIFLALIDHIQSTINLHKDGKNISNALIWDIKHLYKKEYEIGEYALRLINKTFDINIPQDEAGFIALHIVNASLDKSGDTYQITEMIKSILTIIKYDFKILLDVNSIYYQRLINHLRFFAQRVLSNEINLGLNNEKLFETTKKEFPKAYKCSLKIKKILSKQYDYTMSNDEILYLIIHIQRAIKVIKGRENIHE